MANLNDLTAINKKAKRGLCHDLGIAWGILGLVLFFSVCSYAGAPTVTVRDSAELLSALQATKGGETIYLEAVDPPYDVKLVGKAQSSPLVKLVSADARSPARIRSLILQDAQNLTFEGLNFSSNDVANTKTQKTDIMIVRSKNIAFVNCTMQGSAEGYLSEANMSAKAGNLALIRWSSNIRFEGNTISYYYHGLAILETSQLGIIGNDISKMQGDGIRMGGVAEVAIQNNYIHDFLGSDQTVNHSDMIQLWSTNAEIRSHGIRITGNRLLSGIRAGTQTIFMRNELADRDPASDVNFYENIRIENNLIQNAHTHGITVGEANQVDILQNTLLFNPQSRMGSGEQRRAMLPAIHVAKRSRQVSILNNVTSSIAAGDDAGVNGNLTVKYRTPGSPQAVENLYYGASGGGALPITAFKTIPGSLAEAKDLGSSITRIFSDPNDPAIAFLVREAGTVSGTFDFQAVKLLDGSKYGDDATMSFDWDFGDGTKANGNSVAHEYKAAGLYKAVLAVTRPTLESANYWTYILVSDPLLFRIAIEGNAIVDSSSYHSSVRAKIGQDQLLNLPIGFSFKLEAQNFIEIKRDNPQIFGLPRFGLSAFIKCDFQCGEGTVAAIHKSFDLKLTDRDELQFKLIDVSGNELRLRSGRQRITDGNWHHIAVNYDSILGEAKLYVDGMVASSAAAKTATQPSDSWGMSFGSPFGRSFRGSLAAAEFSRTPYSIDDIAKMAKLAKAGK